MLDDLAKLKAVSLFSSMDDVEVAAVRGTMQECRFAPGQVIIREGEPGDSFHVITDGQVAYVTVDAAGKEIQLGTSGPGEWFGELSMLTGDPRSVRVKSVVSTATLALERSKFREFLLSHPHAALDVLSVIGRRLARADELLRKSASQNVNEIMDAKVTLWQKIADVIATASSSAPFVIIHLIWFGLWIVWNLWKGDKGFDPFPFGLLTMVVSLEAIFLSIFVLVAQGRSGEIDRISADLDHQTNVKAEQQTLLILSRLDDLERGMHHLHTEHVTITRGLSTHLLAANGEASRP